MQRDALKRHHKKQHLRTHLLEVKRKIETSGPPSLVCAQLPNDGIAGGTTSGDGEEHTTDIGGWQP